jgi:cyclase
MEELSMRKVTENVFAETHIRGCNPGYVVTSEGVVVIDTPQLPTYVKMRQEVEKRGPIRYLINTEHHVDHIVGNYYFNGAGIVISHGEVYKEFMVAYPEINPYAYAKEAVSMDDPEGESIFPDEETYFANCNKPTITFDGDMSIRLGNHTFELISTPGHTPGVPEEKVVFTGDTIFNQCQTWLYASDVDGWLESLEVLKALDAEYIVPGHGPVCTKKEIDVQKAFLLEWVTAVSVGISKGWSKEECVERISFLDRFPVDIGQEYMGEHVTTHNVAALFDKLTGNE